MKRNTRGKNYTNEEIELIKSMAANAKTDAEISSALFAIFGRKTSYSSIFAKRKKLGISSHVMNGASLEKTKIRKRSHPRTIGGFRQQAGGSAKIAVMFPDEQYQFIDKLATEMNVSFASAVRLLCKRAENSMTTPSTEF